MTTPNTSIHDSTIREIHAIREQLSDKFGGNIGAILADARERQRMSGRRILQRGVLPIPATSNSSTRPLTPTLPESSSNSEPLP